MNGAPAPTRFRGGLAFVLEEIRRRGMIPGLWVEIEVMSEALPFANALPDGWFFRRNGRRVRDNGRYLLDFSVPAVRAFADGVMDRLIGEYGAGYIKMDHNVNGGVGTESGFSPGEGLENHWRAFNRWIAGVMKRHPHVIFENCASGGCRMEYGLLRKVSPAVHERPDALRRLRLNCRQLRHCGDARTGRRMDVSRGGGRYRSSGLQYGKRDPAARLPERQSGSPG